MHMGRVLQMLIRLVLFIFKCGGMSYQGPFGIILWVFSYLFIFFVFLQIQSFKGFSSAFLWRYYQLIE